MSWTEERTAQLRQMHAEGFSFRQIAATLGGISRNAVIGKAQRMDLPGRGAGRLGHLKERPRRQRTITRRHKFKYPQEIEIFDSISDLPPEQPDNPMALFDLTATSCRWPCVGIGVETLFCGGEALKDHAYCRRHCRMAYAPPKRKEQAA